MIAVDITFFFTEFRQYNFTIQQLKSDLQNQVKRIQEVRINVTGDQTFQHLIALY